PFGFVVGALFGLLSAPILVLTLRRKRAEVAVPLVGLLTLMVALFSTKVGSLLWPIVAATACCWLSCLVAHLLMEDVVPRFSPGTCQACGYRLTGNTSGVCPECGTTVSRPPESIKSQGRVFKAFLADKSPFIRLLMILAAFLSVPAALVLLSLPRVLARMTPSDVPALIERLGSDDVELAEDARAALTGLGAAPLVDALKHSNPAVRSNAAQALGALRDRAAVPALVDALTDSNGETRERAARALGQMGDRSVIPELSRSFNDPEPAVRSSALVALQELKAKDASPLIVALLEDPSALVVARAVTALGHLGDENAIRALLPLVSDDRREIADAAVLAIARLSGAPLARAVGVSYESLAEKAWQWWRSEGASRFAASRRAIE
ncbi:MAG: HEAT repeat domain-containing protein, partial [Phycisphaerae bacterium]|nr:HEAT repeat domain-containing protein [Phycisphaerae bacterium]